MNEHPILFSASMVKAILEGRKTQTRRVVKGLGSKLGDEYCTELRNGEIVETATLCPYGVAGDHLWVRETWRYDDWTEDGEPYIRYAANDATQLMTPSEDWADRVANIWAELSAPENYNIDQRARDRKWRPPIFLPRWASRITLEVLNVRVERVQDISEEDAITEGIDADALVFGLESGAAIAEDQKCRAQFADLWDSINAKRGYGWDANPWVWVIEFKQVQS